MSMYLCYDLKGIQQYIFQIPKLKCCIGGSRQIDTFDREDAGELTLEGIRKIYTGGGKGAFECDSQAALEELKQELLDRARLKGLTIRFGISDDYFTAAREIAETYCFQPDSLEGAPCEQSGLYPTLEKIHPLIRKRIALGSCHEEESPVESRFLKSLREIFKRDDLGFFYNVSAGDEDGWEAAEALGNRNRWAVVCMDGNDMGSQFLAFAKNAPRDPAAAQQQWSKWLPEMSQRLDECTRSAAEAGMIAVAEVFLKNLPDSSVLPLRPLIVGGDDVTVLVHCEYAMLFVKTVMAKFNELSRKYAHLWCGTNGEMTISAGILYAPVTLPLHSALSYAEMLLASAKTHGRELKKEKNSAVSLPCVDWESVTEGLLVSPGIRRCREFRFYDKEIGKNVELTSRPYSLEELSKLEKAKALWEELPRNIRFQIHPALFAPKDERAAFYARLLKNHPEHARQLREPIEGVSDSYGSAWEKIGDDCLKTNVIDILLLAQEEYRLAHPTVSES
ncbi:MAG: hypothetical protein IJV93_08780 [Lentisphaeria bacterium]|nr:hypothetical protein [Lentisphaeria bacterium]